MRSLFIGVVAGTLSFTGLVWGQGIAEFGAVTAGATVGGAAGKAVTDALTKTLSAVSAQTAEAASTPEATQEKLVTEKLAPEKLATEKVPAKFRTPKELAKEQAAQKGAGRSEEAPFFASLFELPELPDGLTPRGLLADAIPTPAPMPPPEMTRESFKNVTAGMNRSDLLRFGAPSYKVTMDQDGHLVEIYSYRQAGDHIGTVRLADGAVATIQ